MGNDLKQLHKILRGNYRTQWDSDTDDSCRETLTAILGEVGWQRTEDAVRRCLRVEPFFNAAALWKHVPQAPARGSVSEDIERWRVECEKSKAADPAGYEAAKNLFREKLAEIARKKQMSEHAG